MKNSVVCLNVLMLLLMTESVFGYGLLADPNASRPWESGIVTVSYCPNQYSRYDYQTMLQIITPAMTAWENITSLDFQYSGQCFSNASVQVYWEDSAGSGGVQAYVIHSRPMRMIIYAPVASQSALTQIITHEFGHVVGLADTYMNTDGNRWADDSIPAIMNRSSYLTQDDINGAQALYPSGNTPSAPFLRAISRTGNDVTIRWNHVYGAGGYKLYFSDYPAASYTENIDLGWSTSLTVELPPGGGRFFVFITAYNHFGESNSLNSNIRITPP